MTYLVFDIETGPVPDEELERLFTYDETAIKGYNLLAKEFDPSEVKHGNRRSPRRSRRHGRISRKRNPA